MKARRLLLTLTLLTFTFTLFSCSHLQPQEQGALVGIAARRLAATGAKMYPTVFKDLGTSARDACEKPDETMQPSQVLELIAQAVTQTLDDKLLAADLRDLAALLGIRFDDQLKLIGVTEDQQRLIKTAVCSFAEGIEIYSQP